MQNFTHARENFANVPKELIVEIALPLAESASSIDLDVFESELVLDSDDPAYHLEVTLPYCINDKHGSARFDTTNKTLLVTLPVLRGKHDLKGVENINTPQLVQEITQPSVNGKSLPLDSLDDAKSKSEQSAMCRLVEKSSDSTAECDVLNIPCNDNSAFSPMSDSGFISDATTCTSNSPNIEITANTTTQTQRLLRHAEFHSCP
jgi:hypothetical protein